MKKVNPDSLFINTVKYNSSKTWMESVVDDMGLTRGSHYLIQTTFNPDEYVVTNDFEKQAFYPINHFKELI